MRGRVGDKERRESRGGRKRGRNKRGQLATWDGEK